MRRKEGALLGSEAPRTRIVVINLLVLSLLATLAARLWFLQVMTGPEAQQLAERTSVRIVYRQAPRGFVFDRNGTPLATNRTALTVALDVSRLPPERRDEVVPRLAEVLDMDPEEVLDVVTDERLGFYTPRPLALDVPKEDVIYLLEHRDEFPGVTALEIPVRQYPQGELGAHVVGYIGRIGPEEYEARRDDYQPNDLIGKVGVEARYEEWLRGTPGQEKIAVNVRGEKVENLGSSLAERGWDAILTLDADLQQAAESALVRGMELAQRLRDPDTGTLFEAPAGAVVALDPSNGEILALSSKPSFDPNVYVPPRSEADADAIRSYQEPQAEFNRAIAEQRAPASTFKPVSAVAAWDAALVSPNRSFACDGTYDPGRPGGRIFRDWKPGGHGEVGLSRSLTESCDIVYYTLGEELNAERYGEKLQDTARAFGFGQTTGIDLPGEEPGLVGDDEYKQNTFSNAAPRDRAWQPGDNVNLAIGQGFLQATPLQVAVAYGAIANGGVRYRPHVMKCLSKMNVSRPVTGDDACSDDDVKVPEPASPRVLGRAPVPPGALDFVAEAMAGTGVGDGTAATAFAGFPFDRVSVAGKTGTAQVTDLQPFSWFAAFAPVDDPEIVVVAMVEEAGSGSQIAAPIVRQVLERHFGLQESDLEPGERTD